MNFQSLFKEYTPVEYGDFCQHAAAHRLPSVQLCRGRAVPQSLC